MGDPNKKTNDDDVRPEYDRNADKEETHYYIEQRGKEDTQRTEKLYEDWDSYPEREGDPEAF